MIFLYLFLEFFKIGLFTFGGGYSMIPLIKEVVLKYQWLTEEQFYDFLGVCESTPGPIAINLATFVGTSQGGILGAIVATLGVVLPSFIIIILISSLLKKVVDTKAFKGFLKGVTPVVVGLILSAGIILFIKNIGYVSLEEFNFNYRSLIIFVLICLVYFLYKIIFKKKINNVFLILLSAGFGLLICVII